MRRFLPVLLAGMMVALVVMLWVRRDVATASAPAAPTVTTGSAGSGSAGSGSPGSGSAAPVASKPPAANRTLRTVALGWELIAPGIVAARGKADDMTFPCRVEGGCTVADEKAPAAGSGSGSAVAPAGMRVAFANANSMEDVASALARGGDAGGADVAIVPLVSYAAAYERLRALAPEIVFVVGHSHGREGLFGGNAGALARLADDVAADRRGSRISITGTAGEPETFLALFLLELAGVPPGRIDLAKTPTELIAGQLRGTRPSGKLLFTSADTPRLLPYVAVAPRGFIEAHRAELEAWTRGWLIGVDQLQRDVPAAARKVAAQPAAPATLAIIEALGQIEFANLRDNAAALGLSGRGAVTLEEIWRATWRIWRDTGLVTTAQPEVTPVHEGLVATLAREGAAPKLAPPRRPIGAARPELLLAVRIAPGPGNKLDNEAFVNRVGYIACVFDRLPLRIAIAAGPPADRAKTATTLAELARDRFGLRGNQLSTGAKVPAGSLAAIEVLSGD